MDKYDRAIEHLKNHPDQLRAAYDKPYEHQAGCLFACVCNNETRNGGCLVMVAHEGAYALDTRMTLEIRSDTRIPTSKDLTIEHLEVFAEWQRKADAAGRV